MSNEPVKQSAQERVNKIMADIDKELIKPMTHSEQQEAKLKVDRIKAKTLRKQNKELEREIGRSEKPDFLVFIGGILEKPLCIFLTIYEMAIVVNAFFIWQIYKVCSVSGWQGIFQTKYTLYVLTYFVLLLLLGKLHRKLILYVYR